MSRAEEHCTGPGGVGCPAGSDGQQQKKREQRQEVPRRRHPAATSAAAPAAAAAYVAAAGGGCPSWSSEGASSLAAMQHCW